MFVDSLSVRVQTHVRLVERPATDVQLIRPSRGILVVLYIRGTAFVSLRTSTVINNNIDKLYYFRQAGYV